MNSNERLEILNLLSGVTSSLGYVVDCDDVSAKTDVEFYTGLASLIELNKLGIRLSFCNLPCAVMCCALIHENSDIFMREEIVQSLVYGDYTRATKQVVASYGVVTAEDGTKLMNKFLRRYRRYLAGFGYSNMPSSGLVKWFYECIVRQIFGKDSKLSINCTYDVKYLLKDLKVFSDYVDTTPSTSVSVNTLDIRNLLLDDVLLGYRFCFDGEVRDISLFEVVHNGVMLTGVHGAERCELDGNMYVTKFEKNKGSLVKSMTNKEFFACINAIPCVATSVKAVKIVR